MGFNRSLGRWRLEETNIVEKRGGLEIATVIYDQRAGEFGAKVVRPLTGSRQEVVKR